MPLLPPLRFPNDLLRLLYWVFFKPLTLERYIRQIDPELKPRTGLLTLWRRSKVHPELHDLVMLTLYNILITSWMVSFLPLSGVTLVGVVGVDWLQVVSAWMISVTIGVLVSMVGGVAVGVGFAVAFNIPFGVGTFGAGLGMTFGATFGIAFSVTFSTAFGIVVGLAVALVVGLVVGVVYGVAGGGSAVIAVGMVYVVPFLVGYFRLFFYFCELPFSLFLAWTGARLELSPIYWDELIWLPLWGLDWQIVNIGRRDRLAALAAIAHTAQSFRQGWAAQSALLQMVALDVERAHTPTTIAEIAATLTWLPPDLSADWASFLPGLYETAAHVQAALESDTLYNRQFQYQQALVRTRQLRQGLALVRNRRLAQRFGPGLEGWEAVCVREIQALAAQQFQQIPNVYVAGIPLKSESKVFKGRRDLFLTLEHELSSAAEQRPALLLYGGRRVGKTSTLRQFPSRLGPAVIPVDVSLEDPAAASDIAALLGLVAARVVEGARLRRVEMPHLSELSGDPYLAFKHWLGQVEAVLGERWILLTLDEYEYLGRRVEEGRLDERIFQMLRDLVQNHPHFSLLLSGAHTLEELSPIYSRYLLNMRVLKIGPLAETDARELILHPIDPFPISYDPLAVEHLLQVSGCQPYFIQTVCKNLVDALNSAYRSHASLEDVEAALDSALSSAAGHFKDLWDGLDSDDTQRAVLRILAYGRPLPHTDDTRRALSRLVQRDILVQSASGYQFQSELVARWVRRVV